MLIRVSTRSRKPPGYFEDYHCRIANFDTLSLPISITKGSTHPHDISKYLSYNKVSPANQVFAVYITSHKKL